MKQKGERSGERWWGVCGRRGGADGDDGTRAQVLCTEWYQYLVLYTTLCHCTPPTHHPPPATHHLPPTTPPSPIHRSPYVGHRLDVGFVLLDQQLRQGQVTSNTGPMKRRPALLSASTAHAWMDGGGRGCVCV